MSRSKWKGPYVQETLKLDKKNIAARASEILPKFVGLTFLIHNGCTYKSIDINKDMIGHKFGEFFNTRAKYIFKKKKQKKKK